VVVLQSDFVGPRFSSTLITSSVKAILIAVLLILAYIWIRFRFAYAISAIIALLHDILMMLVFITIFRLEVSSTTIAAVLTIIGYSLNNTIVIFDRVRENVELLKGQSLDTVIDTSVTQSLTRTIITSLTTLFAVVPLAIFTNGSIQLFALNLIWGIVIGTFSSNFLAPALLHWFNKVKPVNVEKLKKHSANDIA
ncbi:MAG: protein translocase subunit SecF, partial [Spirochaetales bacterium]|nr:protein translocase subunit SecF [Spirochaetales bacterium]